MPSPVNRESLTKGLLERYYTQKVGGAFDAKKPTPDIFEKLEKDWTPPGFGGIPPGIGIAGIKKGKSKYIENFTNKNYAPNKKG